MSGRQSMTIITSGFSRNAGPDDGADRFEAQRGARSVEEKLVRRRVSLWRCRLELSLKSWIAVVSPDGRGRRSSCRSPERSESALRGRSSIAGVRDRGALSFNLNRRGEEGGQLG
jgi:hypothetical protein